MELIFRKRKYTLNGGESAEVEETRGWALDGLDNAVAGVFSP